MADLGSFPGFLAPAARVEACADGSFVVSCTMEIGPYPTTACDWLDQWAEAKPDAPFMCEREGGRGPWRELTYGTAAEKAWSIATALLRFGLSSEQPVMIIADNSIDHALLALGAQIAGVPFAPISTGYAEAGRDFSRLRAIAETLTPGLLWAGDGERFGDAVDVLGDVCEHVLVDHEGLDELCEPGPDDRTRRARSGLTADTIAKILFSSGSTGTPKGVLNTQRMICSNQASLAGLLPFLTEEAPVLVDWLPWSHTFGGNHDFNLVLSNGGTFYIDAGRPVPGLMDLSIQNLREISPTIYFNVPRAYDQLVGHLETDAELRERFFAKLRALQYAGAALPAALRDRLLAVSERAWGAPLPLLTGWGLTETAPMATMLYYPTDRANVIGLPGPGTTLKLAAVLGRYELRVRGPNVTPGYLESPDLTEAAFDEDGFFRTGDAAVLIDPEDPTAGIVFDGRLTENFKLMTGSWAIVGKLRLMALSTLSPLVQDCVVAGEERNDLRLLLFVNLEACRRVASDASATPETLATHAAVRGAIARGLAKHNAVHTAASERIEGAMIMLEPPSVDDGEITDKGYINQRAVLRRRAALVEQLYDDTDLTTIRPA